MTVNRHAIYFDEHIKLDVIKKTITGKTEDLLLQHFKMLGYEENVNYFRQFPFNNEFVLDFAFPEEKVAIEFDGESHKKKAQKIKDAQRDKSLILNGWVVIRVLEKHFLKNEGYYRNIIQQVVDERTEEARI